MHALVTGGAGFIGSHLIDALVEQGHAVTVLDNLETGCLSHLQPVQNHIQWVHGDICNPAHVKQAMKGVDTVFHLAALTSVNQSFIEPERCMTVNVEGTRHVLDAAVQQGVQKVILSSSCAIYGDNALLPISERATPCPKSPYAESKRLNEQLAAAYFERDGLETVCLRYFNVYGPRQNKLSDYASVIPKWIDCYRQGISPTIFGDGLQSRDFVHVSDVVQANLLAAQFERPGCHAFNIATGQSVSLLQVLDWLSALFEHPVLPPRFQPARQGDIRHSGADITFAQNALGYRPSVFPEAGLRDLLSYQQAKQPLVSLP